VLEIPPMHAVGGRSLCLTAASSTPRDSRFSQSPERPRLSAQAGACSKIACIAHEMTRATLRAADGLRLYERRGNLSFVIRGDAVSASLMILARSFGLGLRRPFSRYATCEAFTPSFAAISRWDIPRASRISKYSAGFRLRVLWHHGQTLFSLRGIYFWRLTRESRLVERPAS